MADTTLNIWCNARLTPETKALLREGIGAHRLVFADEMEPSARSSTVAVMAAMPPATEIAFGQPDAGELMRSERLRWAQISSAGYTAYDRDDLKEVFQDRGRMLTSSSNVYAEPVAQHLLALMFAHARRLPHSFDNQRTGRAWPFHATRAASRLLNQQTVLLLSFGHIARRAVELLAPLGMKIIAVRRQVQGDEPVPVVAETEVETVLPVADHIVNLLPGSAATNHFLNARRLGLIKPGAILYNLGRGTTIDQQALIERLQSGQLAAAYLDVTDPEPLPPAHPLWTTPNCYITPHSAGGHENEMQRLVGHFLDNFGRFTSGQPLQNRVI